MYLLSEILKYILPSLVVFGTAYVLITKFFEREEKQRRFKALLNNHKLITPIRLQAYERIILFLERISPDSLIIRTLESGMTAKQLQTELLQTIRVEFEHNLSQQLYITPDAWKIVKASKENVIKLINSIASEQAPDTTGLVLSKTILETVVQNDIAPTATAIEYLKKEVSDILLK